MTTRDDEVHMYLLSDRQWPREQCLAHARLKLSKAKDQQEKEFYQAIVDANSIGPLVRRPTRNA